MTALNDTGLENALCYFVMYMRYRYLQAPFNLIFVQIVTDSPLNRFGLISVCDADAGHALLHMTRVHFEVGCTSNKRQIAMSQSQQHCLL